MGRWQRGAAIKAAAIRAAGGMLTDEQAVKVPAFFKPWQPAERFVAGDRRQHGSLLYRCLQSHSGQADWSPDVAVSLWTKITDPAIEWPEWVQPESTNPYNTGDKVTFEGSRYISKIDNNVWSPTAHPAGWEVQL